MKEEQEEASGLWLVAIIGFLFLLIIITWMSMIWM